MECWYDTTLEVFRTRQTTSGLVGPKHLTRVTSLALKIYCKADKFGQKLEIVHTQMSFSTRLMEGVAVLELLRLPGSEQPPDL